MRITHIGLVVLTLLLAVLSSQALAQSPTVEAGILQSDGREVHTLNLKSASESRLIGAGQASLHHSAAGWFVGGVGSGFVLGPLGTTGITLAALVSHPQPAETPPDVIGEDFLEGYESGARKKNVAAALGGGLVGTALLTAMIVHSLNHLSVDIRF